MGEEGKACLTGRKSAEPGRICSLVFPSLLQLLPDQPDTHFQLPLFLIVVHVSEGGLENGQNSFSYVTAAKREGMALQGGIMVANLCAVDRFIFSS